MYKIAICDDNIAYLELIKKKIQKYCRENNLNIILDSFDDSDMLAECIEEKKRYDAYILDIEMPNISGVELAEKIRTYSENSYIIFLTAHDIYAVRACGVNVLSYILKERIETELEAVLKRLFERLERQNDEKTYTISNQRKYIKILQKDIIYIYKNQKNVVFVLDGTEEECDRTTLQEVYQRLANPDMYPLDRGLIINLRHVRKIVADRVKMNGGYDLLTSKVHANELKEHIMLYWGARI